jgi:hypothetical protein
MLIFFHMSTRSQLAAHGYNGWKELFYGWSESNVRSAVFSGVTRMLDRVGAAAVSEPAIGPNFGSVCRRILQIMFSRSTISAGDSVSGDHANVSAER